MRQSVRSSVGLMASVAALAGWTPAHAQQLSELFRKVSPSVVLVRTVERSVGPERAGLTTIPGLGSGVLISAEGKIMTAAHVVQTADRVGVQFQDGKVYPAHVVASSVRADVALLQLDQFPMALAPAKLGNSDSLAVGDQIIVIGAPYGLGHSLTVGHVSGRIPGGGMVSGGPMEMIQTDAAINMGNSGGPMFNMNGEVVGIVSRILTQSGGFEGLGFAIPSKVAERVLLNAKSFWSGIDFVVLQDTMAQVFNVPQPAGLLVQQVAAGSPGALLGIRAGTVRAKIGEGELLIGGDIVLEVAGIAITPNGGSFEQIQNYLSGLKVGDSLKVNVLRGGKVVHLAAPRAR
ncbi:MAG TPA: trypsin-like peptidase domain-containing protein [Gemmatimonadales bacterium]|nr:trypsin-like peptidase domain-containing protein [Gemmatimonadales bacterium]